VEIFIGVFISLLIVGLAVSSLTGRAETKQQQRARHYQELNAKDTAARKRLDAAAARERRNDPDAPENFFKAAAAQSRQQAALERQAYQLVRAEQRRQLAQTKRQEAAEKRKAKAEAARAKAREQAARERAKAKAQEKREREQTKKQNRAKGDSSSRI
jgi:colicin import membrane protein